MRRAIDLDDFRTTPIDRYVTGRSWLAFLRADFSGLILWGHLSGEDALGIAQLLPFRYLPPAIPHPTIVDCRLLQSIDSSLLATRENLLRAHWSVSMSAITRSAVVHTPGQLEAITVGMQALCKPPFPEKFFTDATEALAWLEREDEAPLLAELERIRCEAAGLTPLLTRLRDLLANNTRVSLDTAARSLAVSRRTLQRVLAGVGTAFQDEVIRARVESAQRLLLQPGNSVSQVALAVGCSSSQHLNKQFRRVVGETPTAWRARVQQARAGR